MKYAVCIIIEHPHFPGTFLSVSRKNDNTKWGFPGGKVDEGETALQAVIRETQEEVGITLNHENINFIYEGICPGKNIDDTYIVLTYRYKGYVNISNIIAEEGINADWKSAEFLSEEKFSPFSSYNRNALSCNGFAFSKSLSEHSKAY